MHRFFLGIAILAASFTAQADILKCDFTEPFYQVTYSMAQQSLRIESPDSVEVLKGISFQIKGPGLFELWDANKVRVMELNLNFAGSNGMSDTVYPYDARWLTMGGLWGGCISNFLPAKN